MNERTRDLYNAAFWTFVTFGILMIFGLLVIFPP